MMKKNNNRTVGGNAVGGNTVGAVASELQQKKQDPISAIELQRATEKEYLDNLVWCVKHARKEVECSSIAGHEACIKRSAMDKDFFVAALLKKEKLLENVLRNYFVPTVSCPTPHFDQTVYRYNHAKGDIEFLWVIPDKESCEVLRDNKNIVVPAERALLQFVLDYYNGTLFQIAKKLNGETVNPGSLLK
jgi:hypothetical protein